ncbi:TadE/TadG family type IV pilus assembly protein [Rhodoferax sp.]|uniref:TadE family protein n=1 Tax=Rhodoferax sp. TaxID=50421 RepID=UPI0025E03B99|nr:TadE/TadG family type IV pilus assembly protein [Rhodoferax sp.]MCM2342920.1 pilus assembly protein [Rhodoferax sp.]
MKTIFKPGRQKGVAAVELAFILPLMLILVFGITELGRALYQYNGLVKATRGAVRYLAQQDLANLSASSTPTLNEVYATTKALAVCGKEDCAGQEPLVTGLSTTQVTLCDYLTCVTTHKGVPTGKGTVDLVTVTIGGSGNKTFSFSSLVPFVIPDIDFSPVKTTMVSRYF